MSRQNVSRLSVRLLHTAASLLSLTILFLIAAPVMEAQTATGRVSGTVTSRATGNALQGARVSLPTLGKSTLSDSAGHFVFFDVPPGEVNVVASYSGFDEGSANVTVGAAAGAEVALVLNSTNVVELEKFTVSSMKEGQALAVTEQRNANNIKNVTALDEWGNLPTLSVGELAARLPGISFTVDEDNLINNVSVRGMPSGYTRLNIDGMSSTGVGGDGRTATLHSFSGAMYEQIEVIAGQTPDKRADSLGGQLNLKTRSPLAMKEKRRINYNVAGRWSAPFADRTDLRKDHPIQPVTSFAYQERFDAFGGTNNFALALNVSHSEIVNMLVYDSFFYQATTDPAVIPAFNDYTTQAGINTRFITGLSLRADYRWSPRSTFSLRLLYNAGSEPYYDRVKIDPLGNTTVGTTGTASIMPGFTENRTELRQTGTAGATRMDLEMWKFGFFSENPTATFAGEHDLGRLKIDYMTRWSNTKWHSAAGRDQGGGQLTMRADNIGFTLDKTDNDAKVFTQTAGASVLNPESYTTNIVLTKRDTITRTNEVSAAVNATYQMGTKVPVTLKTGMDSVNRRVNNRQVNPRRWNRNASTGPSSNPIPGVTNQIPLTGYSLMAITPFEVKNTGGARVPTVDPSSINDLTDTTKWTEDLVYASQQPFTNRRIMEEGVDSAYAMATSRVGRLTLLGGVRWENVQVNTFNYIKRFSTTAAAEPDPFKRALLDYQPHTTKGHYDDFYPSIHAAYDITPNLKARASWSTSYGRPSLAQLVPAIVFNDTARTVTAGNPGLLPQTATNYDVKLEYYTKNGGIISIGAFRKDIKDYILNIVLSDKIPAGPDNGFEGNFEDYTLTAPTNAGDARAQGLEFEYRQRFTFLPGLLKGLGFSANYTFLETTGRFAGTAPIAKDDVPGFIPRTGNVRLTYNYRNFGASAGLNFTGHHISGAGVEPVSPLTPIPARLYRKDLTTYNVGVSYKIRPELTVYADVNNLTQNGPEVYRSIETRARLIQLSDVTINFGISGQF
jgi:iron complex outermembrane receptor protein